MSDPMSLTNIIDDDYLDVSINTPSKTTMIDLSLVGKILSDKKLNFSIVKNILLSAWKTKFRIKITILEQDLILCNFSDPKEMEKILSTSLGLLEKTICY